jgi:hypothetical protein
MNSSLITSGAMVRYRRLGSYELTAHRDKFQAPKFEEEEEAMPFLRDVSAELSKCAELGPGIIGRVVGKLQRELSFAEGMPECFR